MTNLLLRGSLAVIDRTNIPIISTLAGGFKDFLEFYKEIKDNQQRDADKQLLEEKLAELTQWHQELNQALLSKHGDVTQLYAWKDEITQTLEKLLAGQKYATGQLSELNAEQPIALTLDLLPEKNRRALETALKRGPLDLKNLDPEHANIITNDTQFILPWKTLKEAMRGSEPASLVATGDRNGLEVVVKDSRLISDDRYEKETVYSFMKEKVSDFVETQIKNLKADKETPPSVKILGCLYTAAVIAGIAFLGFCSPFSKPKPSSRTMDQILTYDGTHIIIRFTDNDSNNERIPSDNPRCCITLCRQMRYNDRVQNNFNSGFDDYSPEELYRGLTAIQTLADNEAGISNNDIAQFEQFVMRDNLGMVRIIERSRKLISSDVAPSDSSQNTPFINNPPKFIIQAYVDEEWKDETTVASAEKYRIAVLKEHLGWPQHYTIDVENKETALAVKRLIMSAEENDAKNDRLLQDYFGKQVPGRVFYFGYEVVRLLEALPKQYSDLSANEISAADVAKAKAIIGTDGGLEDILKVK